MRRPQKYNKISKPLLTSLLRIFQIKIREFLVVFSGYLNFNEYKMSTITKLLGYLKRPCFDPLCIEKKMTSFFPIKPQSMTHIHSGFALQFQSCGVSWPRTKFL